MRVSGIIYADEKLLKDIRQDKAPEQVANVAFLPGIVNASLAMPDIHWGYGFCVTKDTNILTNFGFYKSIVDFRKDWSNQNLKCIDLKFQRPIETPILRFIKLKPKKLFRVITKTGYKIEATGDHPFFTPVGMKPIEELSYGERVAVFPFQGIPYEEPSNEIIISEEDIRRILIKLGRKPGTPKFEIILQKLKNRALLPLTYNHPKLPYVLKIMGFVFGDASMNFIGRRQDGVLHFAGKSQDLEEVRRDLNSVGYSSTPIHFRKQKDSGSNKYYNCYSFNVDAASLVVLLETLGVPRGSKVDQAYRVPKWIFKALLWQKRLFLASLFGCELRIPHRRLERRGYFNVPVFPMAKREDLIKNGEDFLKDIAKLLKEFGVRTLYIDKRKRHISKKGEISRALELLISPKPENLFNLWSKVGFEYNFKRSFVANVAVHYLRLKLRILQDKEEAIRFSIPDLLKRGFSYQKVALQLAGNPLTKRFIMDVCYELNKGRKVIVPRIPAIFPEFEDYVIEATEKLGQSGMVWDEIDRIEKIPCQDFVYDFTVSHSDHNFIADNFVVSNCIGGVAATDVEVGGVISPSGVGYDVNCGVRLLKTNFQYEEIKNKIKDLVYVLFSNIPSGVGSKGDIRVSEREEREILVKGAKWAVEKGYGTQEDLECTEEYGAIQGADPLAVSDRAYQRGKAQSGTLGSGNHFLEIQVIDQLYDQELCDEFGLTLGQITIMIHSGSRGLGYQVCDDYVKSMLHCLQKYNINLPDRQLACAPVNSPEGKAYLGAMRCAANYAWANRQCLMYLTRKTFEKVFAKSWQDMNMYLIYDVAHNIAKIERHIVDGKEKTLCVHRKGATRAFGPGHPVLPDRYKKTGQPVIIPGDMGRNSYLLVGTQKAMEETFGSTCFTGDTRILTDKGIVTLKEIYEFNKLGLIYNALSVNNDTLSVEWKPILGVNKRVGSAMRISVSQTNRSRFSTLDTTLDHKFSVFDNAKLRYEEIGKIIESQKMVCVLDKVEIPWVLHYPRLAYLVGALATDGYIDRKNKRIIFTQKKTDEKKNFIDYVRSSLELVFEHDLNEGKIKYGKGFIRGKPIVGAATDFVTGKKDTAEEIVSVFDNLQTWILGLNQESTFDFLAGIIDGDGTWSPTHGVIEIFSGKERVIGGVILACLKLGILPYVSIQRNNCYIIQISERLEEILRFTKRVKGSPHKMKYGSKLFSIRQLFTENWVSGNIKWPFTRKADRNNLMERDKILRFLAWQSSSRYKREQIIKVVNSPLRIQRVKKITDLGIHELYNIEVQDNHNYFVFTKTFVPVLVKNCHGAGRVKSRTAAAKSINVGTLLKELESKGITVKAAGRGTIVEEAPQAYKDVNEVVGVVHNTGISKRVCRMRPLGVIKG
jgi:tRNA-splicing ligase RtcB